MPKIYQAPPVDSPRNRSAGQDEFRRLSDLQRARQMLAGPVGPAAPLQAKPQTAVGANPTPPAMHHGPGQAMADFLKKEGYYGPQAQARQQMLNQAAGGDDQQILQLLIQSLMGGQGG